MGCVAFPQLTGFYFFIFPSFWFCSMVLFSSLKPSLFQCAFFFFVSGAPTMSDTTSALATILSLEAYGPEEQFDVSHMATQSGVYVAILSSCTCLCTVYYLLQWSEDFGELNSFTNI
jgi:hypothetical protein